MEYISGTPLTKTAINTIHRAQLVKIYMYVYL